MAPSGEGRGARRRRGNKPHAHKRRRGGSTSASGSSGRQNNVDVTVAGARKNNRRRNHPRTKGNTTASNSDGNNRKHARYQKEAPSGLQPIKVSNSGIMSTWKKPLGGLIRYYIHTRTNDQNSPVDQKTAEDEIDRFYYRSGCSMEDTKMMILESLGVARDIQQGWIGMSMAIEKDAQLDNIPISKEDIVSNVNGDVSSGYAKTVDGKGINLKQVLRAGEGPAHSHEQWTTIVVPEWAVGKSFFFEVKNHSPLHLSCELFLDGEKVAFNAPVYPNSTSTIRPDALRYYQRHQWIVNDAKKVKFTTALNDTPPSSESNSQHPPTTPRYNGIRPDYTGQRVSLELYPDPTTFGWKFTGSVQESRVEFFEVRMNIGGFVKLDFYYSTGTVKTVMHHPTSGKNQLFRAQTTPEKYVAIMKNPRAHTGQGYRRNDNRPTGNSIHQEEEEGDKYDRLPQVENQTGSETEIQMEDANAPGINVSETYYARDDSYNFKRQGHQNRRNQMSKLQKSKDYAEWIKATNKEYAVIHAKFYVSIPKRMYRAPQKTARGGFKQRKGKQIKPIPLPEQSTVIDVKATEMATLGTKYEATGPPQKIGRSPVRMERINGLTDEKDWKGEPVFEQKLMYRAEKTVNGHRSGDDSDEMSEDKYEQNTSLIEYKNEKIDQVKQYHSELSMFIVDPEESEQLLRNVKNKIHLSESITDVDDIVKIFYNDLIHRQIVGEQT